MNGKKRLLISLVFITVFVLAGAFAWRAHLSVAEARLAQEQEAASRSKMEKEAAEARKDAPALAARLRASQHEASKLNPLMNDTEAFWQRVTELAAEIKAQKASQPKNDTFMRLKLFLDSPQGVFAELMGNPEYAALAKEVWLGQARIVRLDYLRVADLTAEQRDKLEKVSIDQSAAEADIQAVATAMGLDASNDKVIAQMEYEIRRKADAACEEIVGEENSARLDKAFMAGEGVNGSIFSLMFSTDDVALRLSYSEEPLSAEQTQELRNLIYADVDEVTKNTSEYASDKKHNPARQVAMSDKFNEQAAKFLSPVQMAGLAELQEEKRLGWQRMDEASQKRAAQKNAK